MATSIVMVKAAIVSKKPNINYAVSSSFCSKKASIAANYNVSRAAPTGVTLNFSIKCNIDHPTERRSGNYGPPFWDFDYIQSLRTTYKEEVYLRRASELVVQVKKLLEEELIHEPVQQLELIDDLQRMGLSHHFEDNISQILSSIYGDHQGKSSDIDQRDLYSTAIEFRLLRQYGFSISQDVFDCFKNEKGEFKASLSDDTRGLLQLYEASFLLTEGEDTLEQAKAFATNFLQKKVLDRDAGGVHVGLIDDENLSLLVRHALELPIHWRVEKQNARWFIDAYERRPDMNLNVLELAKLDFNILQATYKQELKHVSRWWKKTCLAEKLPFVRDRIVECYYWAVGFFSEPEHGYSRIMSTKFNVFITVIDDIFDVYGTVEELQLFNDAIQRWDMEAMDKLPNYMRIFCLALNNYIDEMAYDVLTEQGFQIIPHLRKSWADFSRTLFQEAKWYSRGYTPTLEEYISNGLISSSVPTILSHIYFLVTNPIEKEVVQNLYKYHDIVQYPSMILRLANDLGTGPHEMERGDVSNSIECYMNESGASREEAREHIKFLICEAWKRMNQERVNPDTPFHQNFVKRVVDTGRIAQHLYEKGDGLGILNPQIKERISTLLFEPLYID